MKLAIVIPTLNEEPALADALGSALAQADDVVVSDGGSTDDTVGLARQLGARLVEGDAGRGQQLNRGAQAADGDVLLFLHADTRLPDGARTAVERAIGDGRVGGGFRAVYDDRRPLLRLGSALINLRAHLTGCPLGDQAQFATRPAWQALGGFRDWPILEDVDFMRRLKRHGRTVLLGETVTTSARRVRGQGVLRGIATNYLIWTLYLAGVPPRRLSRLYRHVR